MTNLIGIYNHLTGEQIVREMTNEELAQRQIEVAQAIAEKAERQAQAQALRETKISAYEKLGLSTTEIEALLPTPVKPIL